MEDRRDALTAAAATVLAVFLSICGCVLGTEEVPDYPGSHLRTFQCSGDYGEPSVCTFTGDGRYAVAVAGERLLFFELRHGNLMGETALGTEALGIEATADGSRILVLTEGSLLAVDVQGFSLLHETILEDTATAISLSPDGSCAWVLCDDGIVIWVDTSSWEISGTADTGIPQAMGLVASGDGNAILVGNCGDSTVCRLGIPDMQLQASSETWAPVLGLFPGPEGMFSGLVEGSNEVWFWRESDCQVDYLTTVPGTPSCGASMSDGSFLYAGVPGTGLVIARRNGEHALVTSEFGYPASVAVESAGWNAVLCAPGQMSITILER
jgi:hypothetical protein